MAEVVALQSGVPPEPASGLQRLLVWQVGTSDVAMPADFAQFADRTVQISGAFDGASVAIKGSLDGESWFTLTDPQGNPINATVARLESIMEMTTYVKPEISSAGPSTDIKVIILARRSAR